MKEEMRHRVSVFDFDGTLTTRDTLPAFIRSALGAGGLLRALVAEAPWLALMALGLLGHGRAKERLFARCFRGWTLDGFDAACRRFARAGRALLRPAGLAAMRGALDGGQQVFIVSASVDRWVRPFLDGAGLRGVAVVGTQVEVRGGRLTGRFLTPNCRGPEKVRRLQEALPDTRARREHYYITAYGDSRGDKEMLSYANEAHYKPFRR